MILYLASNSPRRKQLLGLTGWEFQVAPADLDETPLDGEAPREYVLRLAEEKARAAAQRLVEAGQAPGLVLAADTTVVEDGWRILGKPSSPAEAVEVLRRLRGRVHEVDTALVLLRQSDGALFKDLCSTLVPMREYREDEIQAYVDSGDPLDKAGSYAIQHAGFHPVEKLQGCYANVMGLPLCLLSHLLSRAGVEPGSHIPAACQAGLEYACPVPEEIQ
ncbi:MAG TPA: nucleoside triphosphate pyrophosphatase [Anaerolineaceae bacterium]|nr:nucleoside triphosphate pyrophosphatase [Anaerolineaceae bacterium]